MSRTNLLMLFFFIFAPILQGKAIVYDKPLVVSTGPYTSFLFKVSFPQTLDEKMRGLMGVTYLEADQGMLFRSGKGEIAAMWMKNTPLSLDMLFIDENLRVTFIAASTKPFSTQTIRDEDHPYRARYVFEIGAGLCQKLGIKVGDQVLLPLNPKATK